MKKTSFRKQVFAGFFLLISLNLYPQSFVDSGISLPGVTEGAVAWGDYDKDGDADILITGNTNGGEISRIYRNDGDGIFTESGISLTPVWRSSCDWGDYDNDGDLDILLMGQSGSVPISKIYQNEGGTSFTEQSSIKLIGIQWGTARWGDYDNDGNLDILLVGATGTNTGGEVARIYHNNGDNSFTELKETGLIGVIYSSAAWGDYDNDNYADIIITGLSGSLPVSVVYHNNHDGTFSRVISLEGVSNGSTAWCDYDCDGDLDVVFSGKKSSMNSIVDLYRNDGNNTFTYQAQPGLRKPASEGSLAWCDYDNDGYPDLFQSGIWQVSLLYHNNGNNSFTEVQDIAIGSYELSSAAWADYDNDGDADFLVSGRKSSGQSVTTVYRNESAKSNIRPGIPGNLLSNFHEGILTLKWAKPDDNETPQDGLSYNLYIYENEKPGFKLSPEAFPQTDPKNGRRLVFSRGKIQWSSSGYEIRNLFPGKTYSWSVQAIDAGLSGGIFCPEQSFTMPDYRPNVQASSLSFSDILAGSVKLNWVKGGGTKRAVFIKENGVGAADPEDNKTYNINDETTGGWNCIYNDAGNSTVISGLNLNSSYTIQVCEYNGSPGNESYLKSVVNSNPAPLRILFTEQTSIIMPGLYNGVASWVDYNNDGNMDILVAGYSIESGWPVTKLFRNNDLHIFTEASDINLPAVNYGSAAWGDFDNDNYLDLLLTSGFSNIYHNEHGTALIEQTGTDLTGVSSPNSATWSDYNNDGFLDLMLSGFSQSGHWVTKLYRNNKDLTFTEQTASALIAVGGGSQLWTDYDKNGFPDVVISGGSSNGIITKLFRNNQDGTFSDLEQKYLTGVSSSSISSGDFDNDGFNDLIIAGDPDNSRMNTLSDIYRNNGDGSFTKLADAKLKGISNGSLSWGDYDNDGHLDILLTGGSGDEWITRIYHNNNDGTFTEQKGFNLPPVFFGSGLWCDYDNDDDLDILLTGMSDSGHLISRIFRNEISTRNISPSAPGGLQALWEHDQLIFKWNAAADNNTPGIAMKYNIRIGLTPDGNEIRSPEALPSGKLLLAIPNNLINDTRFGIKLPVGKYYWSLQAVDIGNMGSSFTTEQVTTADSIQSCDLKASILSSNSLVVRWKNGNGLRRALFCRMSSSEGNAVPWQKTVYNGEPYFGLGDKIGSTGWFCMYNGKADSAVLYGLHEGYSYDIQVIEYCVNNDGPLYFRTLGNGNPWMFSTSLFSAQSSMNLTKDGGSNAWGDYNNDGYLDLLLTGYTNNVLTSDIYRNNGDGTFSKQDNIILQGINGSAEWGDYDNDGYLDLLLTGETESGTASIIYHNNLGLTFSRMDEINLTPVSGGYATWGDYNNDGFADILLIGRKNGLQSVTKIYRNNSGSSFDELTDTGLEGVSYGSATWGDYDNDGDQDMLITGSLLETVIYSNEGNDKFQRLDGSIFPRVDRSSATFMDYNHDGYKDILISGRMEYGETSKLYINNGNNSYTEQTSIILPGLQLGSTTWGDYNNDSYPDILYTGNKEESWALSFTRLHRNNGNNSFTEVTGTGLPDVSWSQGIWGDYDNDGDADIFLGGNGTTKNIFRNNLIMRSGNYSNNMKPIAPSGLKSLQFPGTVELIWSPVIKDETPPKGMTYNVRIGITETGIEIVSPLSDVSNGFRRIAKYGNAQFDTIFIITGLPSGKYYWSVQAVDNGFAGGAWSAVSSFTVKQTQAFFTCETVCLGNPSQFNDLSFAEDGISAWKWNFGDGETSEARNPVHTYSLAGSFNVRLTITDNTSTEDTYETTVVIKEKPSTSFSSESVCQGIPVTATNLTNDNGLTISSWDWDFGDGSSATIQQPAPHPYLAVNDYTIKLKAIASNGCADSVSKIVSVGSYPVAAVTSSGPLTFCKGDSVTLSVPLVPGYSYSWKTSGTNLTGATGNTYMAKNSGNYTAEIVNPKGNCMSTSPPVSITVLDAPSAPLISTGGNLTFCQGDSAVLSVNPVSGYSYDWKLNGGTISTAGNSMAARSSGDYTLVVSNSSGCSISSVNKITVTVNTSPASRTISTSGVTTFCQGSSVTLSVSPENECSYSWRNENGPITGAISTSYLVSKTGVYRLNISNASGCSITTSPVNVLVKQSPGKPVLENANYTKGQCPGESPVRLSTIQVTGYKYQWSKNEQVQAYDTLPYIEFFEAGNYKLTAELNGCSAESDLFSAEFPAGPIKPVIYAEGPTYWYLACNNTEANAYKWYWNGKLVENATKYFFTANQKLGIYQVSVGDKNGCFTKSDPVTIPPGYTGLEETDPFSGLKIYPNPTPGLFTVEMDNNIMGELSIDIFTQAGNKILNIKFEKTTQHFKSQVDLSGQSKGMYVINFLLKKYFATRKVLVE